MLSTPVPIMCLIYKLWILIIAQSFILLQVAIAFIHYYYVCFIQAVYQDMKEDYKVTIPQCKPLSPGEILGCTSPKLNPDTQALV